MPQQPSADFINTIIEAINPYINQYGAEGFEIYNSELNEWMQEQEGLEDAFIKAWMEKVEQSSSEAELSSKFLLKLYTKQRREQKVSPALEAWILNKLEKIADGENAETTLSLKKKKGERKTALMQNRLMVACFYSLLIRQGLPHKEALLACQDKYAITERTIYTFIKDIQIKYYISDKTLKFLSENDISHTY